MEKLNNPDFIVTKYVIPEIHEIQVSINQKQSYVAISRNEKRRCN